MSFVPPENLPFLRCISCEKYLSYYPIYQSLKPQGSICGRCPIEDKAFRNIIYEEVARNQKFPCCYDNNGCLENLCPKEIPLHEKFCTFRKYICPTTTSTKCKWQGLIQDMWNHCQKEHAIYIITENGFEIDLMGRYSENYLLNFEDELYIVNETNSKNNMFSCTVSYNGSNKYTQNYKYKITFQNASHKMYTYEIINNLEKEITLDKDFIINVLENPMVVVATVRILKPNEDKEERYEEVQWSLLNELECSCCLEYMLPPVQQCITGHSICSNCKPKQKECPLCKQDFRNTVNITLGKLIEHLVYPCKNEGCKYTCNATNIKKHESNCKFGKFKCPLHEYENCNESLYFVELSDHILNNHYENLLEMDTVNIPFNLNNDNSDDDDDISDDDINIHEDCFIIKYDFQMFKLHYKYDGYAFFWAMQFIGTPKETERYVFEVDIKDNNGKQRVRFQKECSVISDKTEAFKENNPYIFVTLEQIKNVVHQDFLYCVRILPKFS